MSFYAYITNVSGVKSIKNMGSFDKKGSKFPA